MTAEPLLRGKVREVFAVGEDRLVLVTSDRISAYDVIMPTPIPGKGRVLTALSAYWFRTLADVVPHHMISTDPEDMPEAFRAEAREGRAMLVRRLAMFEIECVVRGYLAGSGWREYRDTGAVCGHALPPGLREGDRLPTPIFTPATKATSGHDENITRERAAQIVGADAVADLERLSIELYRRGHDRCAEVGIILADTKFEFGRDATGGIVLGDEVMTPDSSRFWPADEWVPGRPQPSFDKQFVRDWLDQRGWDHSPPGPELPAEVVAGTRDRYNEAHARITGATPATDSRNPQPR
ncbi:MAG: phosphoribosylaminoimidazolesuccinocarboxamide synthase [Actinobacteria bacterium]|nr:phosphoribosylaminoimidazolesuccinocarboxamide synthase [Thermoleophilia bacterium]MCB9011401.1 phosphoribosylaminoimidazolesuccinocarboxamide synthase [Actinomycetota bacterium]